MKIRFVPTEAMRMDTTLDEFGKLERSYRRRIAAAPAGFRRALAGKIDWEDRLVCVKGPRGAGKTTLFLQHIREAFPERGRALYASLDHLWFATHDLEELVEDHWTHGGTHVFLDEVHHLPEWQTRVKNLYDDFPGVHFAYTGSAMLEDGGERFLGVVLREANVERAMKKDDDGAAGRGFWRRVFGSWWRAPVLHVVVFLACFPGSWLPYWLDSLGQKHHWEFLQFLANLMALAWYWALLGTLVLLPGVVAVQLVRKQWKTAVKSTLCSVLALVPIAVFFVVVQGMCEGWW